MTMSKTFETKTWRIQPCHCLLWGWDKLETDENGGLWGRSAHRKLVLPDKHNQMEQ